MEMYYFFSTCYTEEERERRERKREREREERKREREERKREREERKREREREEKEVNVKEVFDSMIIISTLISVRKS